MNIFNYFGEVLSWDIFTQGVFFSFMLYLGGYLVYITQIWSYKNDLEKRKIEEEKLPEDNPYLKKYFLNLKKSVIEIPKRKIDLRHAVKILSPLVRSFFHFKLILFPLILVLFFTMGIIVNTISDSWIDKDNFSHLGLKSYWANNFEDDFEKLKNSFNHCNKSESIKLSEFNNYNNTDKGIKLISFDRIYRHHKTTICPEKKLQIYYYIKHKLLAEDMWRNYLSYSQVLINLTQGIALSFFSLMVLSSINLVVYIIRKKYLISSLILFALILFYSLSTINTNFKFIQEWIILLIIGVGMLNLILYKKRKILINLLFIILAIGGYYLASNAWEKNEYEVCYKTYGVYKIIDKNIDYNEIKELHKKNY